MAKQIEHLSGRVKLRSPSDLDSSRYTYLSLEQAEPNLGVPDSSGALVVSSLDGIRSFTTAPILSGVSFKTGALDSADSASLYALFIKGSPLDGSIDSIGYRRLDGSIFEIDTLDTVTDRGNVTLNSIQVGSLIVDGIVTTSSLRGYSALVGTASSATTTFVVTVAPKTTNHRYYQTGSALGYVIDGIQSPFLTLLPGKTYRFNQDDGSNNTHQLLFYYDAARTTQYTTNVTTNGSAGSAGSYTEIVVTDTTPVVLHYQCVNHGYMGNAAQFNSNVVDTPYQIIARSGLNVIGSSTFTGVIDADSDVRVGNKLFIGNVDSGTSNRTLFLDETTGEVIAGTVDFSDIPNQISLINTNDSQEHYLVFTQLSSGDDSAKTDLDLTYNAGLNRLTLGRLILNQLSNQPDETTILSINDSNEIGFRTLSSLLDSVSEIDTLHTVTTRGDSTDNAITVRKITTTDSAYVGSNLQFAGQFLDGSSRRLVIYDSSGAILWG